MARDRAQQRGGESVTQGVNDKNIYRKSSRPNGGTDNMRQSRVRRPGIEENKEDGAKNKHPSQREWCVEHRDGKRERQQHAPARDKKERTTERFLEPVR